MMYRSSSVGGQLTCMAAKNVFLVLALMIHIMAAGAARYINVPAEQDVEGGRAFWEQSLPGVPMPSTVAARLSPLTTARAAEFAAMVSKGIISPLNAHELCREADFYCKNDVSSAFLAYGCIQCVTTDTAVDPNLFLPNKELRPGGRFTMPKLYDPEPMKAFLPPSLAQAFMPAFSTSSLPQLLRSLHLRNASNMAHNMANVLATCHLAQEGHVDDRQECVITVQSMVRFVVSVLGEAPLQVISESSHVGSEQEVEVVSLQEEELAMAPVTCHSWVFPFAVYYCHYVKDVRVLHTRMRTLSDGETIERSVLCHRWKELLRPKYEVLGITPGQEACHFIYASNLMFVKRVAST